MVKELNILWTDGFEMKRKTKSFRIFAVLLATVCDIPGTQNCMALLVNIRRISIQ